MARKPQPGGDRNAWGLVMNEFLDTAHNPDGTIKPAGVQTAVATEVETALSVQLQPAVEDAMASSVTLAAAVNSAVNAEPRIAALISDMDEVKPAALMAATRVYDVRDYVSDTTGATDMRTEMQAALNAIPAGSHLHIPQGVVINLGGWIWLSKTITLTGPGELRFTGNASGQSWLGALTIAGNGTVVSGVKITNPSGVGPESAVIINANDVKLTDNTIVNWSTGIAQRWEGEYRGLIISGNTLIDIYGFGSENKGDGILAAGIDVVITNNIVRAKAGTDPRCGIVVEGLAFTNDILSHATSVANTTHIVANNIVTGPFRRSLHAEGLSDYTIEGNVVYGYTWWGIISWGNNRGTIVNNQIHHTYTTGGIAPGVGGSPSARCGICLCNTGAVRATGNTIQVANGSVITTGISIVNLAVAPAKVQATVESNTIIFAGTTFRNISAIAGTGYSADTFTIANNEIRGNIGGGININATAAGVGFIYGNRVFAFTGEGGTLIRLQNFNRLMVHDNYLCNVGIGIHVSASNFALVKQNVIDTGVAGIWFETTTAGYSPDNTFLSLTGNKNAGAVSTTLYGPA